MLEITQQAFDTIIEERNSLRKRLQEAQDREATHVRQMEADERDIEGLRYGMRQLEHKLGEAENSLKKATGVAEGQKQGMEMLKEVITEISSDLADRIRRQ